MADIRIASSDVARPIAPVRFPELSPTGGQRFGAALGQAMADVQGLQQQAQQAAASLATGSAEDSAQSVTAIEKANISFQFALQIRNKLLEAYQEVMRMPV